MKRFFYQTAKNAALKIPQIKQLYKRAYQTQQVVYDDPDLFNFMNRGSLCKQGGKVMFIDIVDACNIRCATCPRGYLQIESTSNIMDLELFQNIIKKGWTEGYRTIALYNWTEPFLNRNLSEYVKIAKEHGFTLEVSTNLSLNEIPHLEETLKAGVDYLIVSVSGDSQEIYQLNHVGGKFDTVTKHLHSISELLKTKKINTEVYLRLIEFDYNRSSARPLTKLAQKLGIHFEILKGNNGWRIKTNV
jgi:molybdenum cofactor biosynthesis enzyme MoaA